MVMTANMLPAPVSLSQSKSQRVKEREDPQKIRNPRNNGINNRPHRVDAQPPRPGMRRALSHDHNVLLDAVRAQDHRLGQRVPAKVLGERRLAVDHHVAALELLVQPAVLLPGLERQQPAEDGGQDDQEDARRGVGARVAGGPAGGVERGGYRGLEDGRHAAVRAAAAAGVHAVAHVHGCG